MACWSWTSHWPGLWRSVLVLTGIDSPDDPDGPDAEIGRTPPRDRSTSAPRSVATRAEIGSGRGARLFLLGFSELLDFEASRLARPADLNADVLERPSVGVHGRF